MQFSVRKRRETLTMFCLSLDGKSMVLLLEADRRETAYFLLYGLTATSLDMTIESGLLL